MATKNLDAYKLGVVLDAAGAAKGIAALADADKKATKLDGSLKQLSKGIKFGLADKFKTELSEVEKLAGSSRASAVGQQLGGMIGGGIKDGIGSVFTASNLGKLIGSAIAPGVGTVVGGMIGSAVDSALEKISGPLMEKIQRGIELNKQLELAQLHYTAFTGSEKEATRHLGELKKLARDAGLDLPMLLTADQRLEEFNDNVKLSELELRAAADAAAAFGSGADGMNSIASALGLIAEKGELSSKTMLKLQKQGIHVSKYLAEAMGLSEKKVKQLIKDNRLNGEVAAQMISEGIEVHKGGFAQRVANETLVGRERQNTALQDSLAQRGTVNVTGGLKDMYGLTNSLLASGAADSGVAFIDRAAGGVIGATKQAVSAGYNFSAGVVQGIASGDALSAIKGAVGSLADTAIGTLKQLWDIHSPSGKGKELGDNFVEGVEVGLVDRTSKGFGRWSSALEKAGGDAFVKGVEGIAKRLGVKPEWLLDVMSVESGFRAGVTNKYGYTGLIQFGKGAAHDVGTTTDALRGMSATQQLPYVERYIAQKIRRFGQMDSEAKLYASVGAGNYSSNDQAVKFRAGSKGYAANQRVWDVNRDGLIQQWEYGVAASRSGQFKGVGGFTINDQPISTANPVPVYLASDLRGGVGMFAGDTFNPAQAPGVLARAQAVYSQTLKDTVPVLVEVKEGQDAIEQTYGATVGPQGLYLQQLERVPGVLEGAMTATYAYSKSQEEYRQAAIRGTDTIGKLAGALGQISGMMPSGGGQVGKKRGFFSKMLGFAAPFLNFIPGVGPILSQIANIGSNALVGNWSGVVSGVAGGLAPGGVFRHSASAPTPALGDVSVSQGQVASTVGQTPEHRATGGPVKRGRAYTINEIRPEPIVFGEDAYIHSSEAAYRHSMGGGGHAHGGIGAMLMRLHDQLERNASALHRFESFPPEHIVMTGLQARPDHATDALMTHGSRDPRVVEWMNRRVNGQ
jgi:tape measure domain-containing protein